ncbi:hypothetical protein [Rhizobium sp. 1399]|uniref:hypothetical protein n=1 Tax=Rhizobium sp. 1399 TaxID=2817758 RepID=UPI0028639464|nr:hypothetical protein [Rhizobium sp. 1399]MDR6663952.1 hypothetical protein [Rhizobium sp. 1399]
MSLAVTERVNTVPPKLRGQEMFAGRYLWWMLTGITLLMFLTICFDYFTWLAVQLSNCVEMAGSCMPVVQFMAGTLKTAGVWTAMGILFGAVMLRLSYLSLLRLWGLLVALWFIASTPFLLFIATGERLQWSAASEALPLAFLFLASLLAYLAIPFEDDDTRPFGASAILRGIVYAAALYGALAAASEMNWLSSMVAKLLGMPALAAIIANVQPRLQEALTLGLGNILTGIFVLVVFIAALLLSLLPPGIVPPLRRKRVKLRQLRH